MNQCCNDTKNQRSNELQLRQATHADLDRIVQLLKISLGEGPIPRTAEFWTWKHTCNPFGESPAMVAESEGTIVGLRAFMRWGWSCKGRVIGAVRAVDTATHPDWRSRGIFSRLTLALVEQMTQEGVGLVFNTPNQKSGPGYLKMGWSTVGRMTMWVRPMRPRRLLGAWLRPGRAVGCDDLRAEGVADFASPRALVEEPGAADLLVRAVGTDKRLVTALTPVYLQWRYTDVPGFEYHAAWAFRAGEGAAVVFRFKRQGLLRELRLCEVVAAPNPDSVRLGARLVRDVVRQADADFASAMGARGTPEQLVLARAGFLPVPRAAPLFTVRPLCLQALGVNPLESASWRLSIGTLELF